MYNFRYAGFLYGGFGSILGDITRTWATKSPLGRVYALQFPRF